ncbi:hypothetical protein [Fibrobacter sp. UWB12]|uniref:hypothetical protein n=1 Tax=Fibrobacter sp. UWB12 TaxID=1896203 RepID=UPI00091CF2D6|nr:hypothetical protein [Fibrobacter sp. UWB12]SHK96163.1 hypothetical protein SAMN05720759_11070 [Fibrobacter sp. UWB12]
MDFEIIRQSIENFNIQDDVEKRFETELNQFVSFLSKDVFQQLKWSNEKMDVKYIPSFRHWLVVVGSCFYKDDETTMFVYSLRDGRIHRECPSFFQNNKYEDSNFDDSFWEKQAPKEFMTLFNLPTFQRTMRIYEELSQKDPFELEIFFDNEFRFSPHNLVINVSHDEFLTLRRDRSVVVPYTSVVHHPYVLQDYINKLGELNGFVCRIVQIVDANHIKIQLDE